MPTPVIDCRIRPPTKASNTLPPTWAQYGELYKNRGYRPNQDTPWDDLYGQMAASNVVLGVLLAEDNETASGKYVPDEDVAEFVARSPGKFLGFAGADPHKGMEAVRRLERSVRELGMHGLTLWPCFSALGASDRKYYPLYAKCVELDIPVTIHTSQHFFKNAPAELGHPREIDQVAMDFPELRIIASHAGYPWVGDMMTALWRHKNVYVDISSMRPKYLMTPGTGWEPLLHFGNSLFQDRILFASGYPALQITECVAEVKQLPLKPEVLEKWLWKNAARFFRLDEAAVLAAADGAVAQAPVEATR
jgi:predicted TIM-barrel fold metal-dependent hydrolase